MSTTADLITQDLLTLLKEVCEIEDEESLVTLKQSIMGIVGKHLSGPTSQSAGSSSAPAKRQRKKKEADGSTSSKTKKIAHKNGYNFYVAQVMAQIKSTVDKNDRMRVIGNKWKALTPDEQEPFKLQAQRYNEYVDKEMAQGDWLPRRNEIIAAANLHACGSAAAAAVAAAMDATTDTVSTVTEPVTPKASDTISGAPKPVLPPSEQSPAPAPAPAPAPESASAKSTRKKSSK